MITTERLMLSQIQRKDELFIVNFLAEPDNSRYLPLERPYLQKEALQWLEGRLRHWEKHRFGTFAVVDKESGSTIGYCGIEHVRDTPFIDIRYGIAQLFWGQGFAYEAAAAVMDYGFQGLGLDRVYGAAVPDNGASIHILQKLGMTSDTMFNVYGDVVSPYSISKHQYEQQQEHVSE